MDSSKGETAMNDAAVAAPRHSHDDTQQKTPNSEVSHRGGKRGSLHSFQHSRPHGRHTVTLVPFERPPTPLRSIEEFMPVWRRQRTPTPTPTDPRPPTPLRSYEEAPPRCVENIPAAEPERPPTPLEAYEEVPVTAVTVAPVDRPPTPLRSYEEVTRGGERTLAAETVEEGPVQPLRSYEEIKRGGERTVMAAPIDNGRPPTPLRGFEIVKPCVAAPINDERPATPLRSYEVVSPCGQRTVMDAPIERPPTPLRGFEIIKPCVAAPTNDEALPAHLRSYEEVTRGGERTLAAETVEEGPVQPLRSFEEIRPGGERTVMAAPIDDGRPPTPLRGFEEVHPAASDRNDAVTVPIKDDRPPSPLRSVEEVEPRTISQSHPTTNVVEETADVAPLHTFEEVPPSSPDQAVAASAAHVDAAAAADAPSEEVIPLESFEEVLPRCAPPAEEEPTHAVASTAGGVSPEQATNTTGAAVDERPRTPLESWECISSVTTRRRITYASVGAQTDAVVEVPPSTMGEPASAVAAERRVTPGEAEAEHTAAPEDTSEAVEREVGAAATHEEALEEPFIEPVVAEQPVKEAEAVTDEPVEHTEAAHSITEEHAEEPVMERERDDLVKQDRPPETEHVYTQVGAEEPVTCDAEKRIEEPQEHDTVLCEGDATKPIQEEAPLEEGVASVHDENMEASQEKCVVSEDAPATPSEPPDDRVDEAHSQHEDNQPDTHAIHSDGEPTGAPVDAAPPQEKEEPAVVPVECVRETPLNYAESAQQSQQPHQQNASDLPLMTPEPQQEEGRSRYAAPPRRSPEGEREIDSAADDHIRRLSDRSGLTSHPGDLPVEQAVHDEPAVGPAATHFVHGKPSVAGDKMVPCFEIDNGLLFRITDSESGKWGFYNDTDEYIMHVRFSLGRKSRVVPLGSMVIQEDPETGRFEGEVMLHPGCTEMVFMGHVNGHRMRYYAIPTSREYHA